jgi:hypothetical protein
MTADTPPDWAYSTFFGAAGFGIGGDLCGGAAV